MKAVEEDDVTAAAEHYAHVNAAHAEEMQQAFCDKGIEIYTRARGARAGVLRPC